MKNLERILLEGARIAGSIHREVMATDFEVYHKFKGTDGASSVYTDADVGSEIALRELFARKLPDYDVFGEELGSPKPYRDTGRVIIVDSLDGTARFIRRLPRFGPIAGVYHDNVNVAGFEYSTMLNAGYFASEESGFRVVGNARNLPRSNGMFVSGNKTLYLDLLARMRSALKEAFPVFTVEKEGNNVNKGRVCHGDLKVYVHLGLAPHDIAAIPVLAKASGTLATDFHGNPYGAIDPRKLIAVYDRNDPSGIYCNRIVVAKPDIHGKVLEVLRPFFLELEKSR